MASMISIEDARQQIAFAGYIGRVSAGGHTLFIYEGDVDDPGTWMAVDRLAIQGGQVNSAGLEIAIG